MSAPHQALTPSVTPDAVTDAQIIETFPGLAEWCVERMVNESVASTHRKDLMWSLLREVLELRRSMNQPTGLPHGDPK